jgi:hypothetical protein
MNRRSFLKSSLLAPFAGVLGAVSLPDKPKEAIKGQVQVLTMLDERDKPKEGLTLDKIRETKKHLDETPEHIYVPCYRSSFAASSSITPLSNLHQSKLKEIKCFYANLGEPCQA